MHTHQRSASWRCQPCWTLPRRTRASRRLAQRSAQGFPSPCQRPTQLYQQNLMGSAAGSMQARCRVHRWRSKAKHTPRRWLTHHDHCSLVRASPHSILQHVLLMRKQPIVMKKRVLIFAVLCHSCGHERHSTILIACATTGDDRSRSGHKLI